ncbi:MAG: hypothetical protein QOJ99_6004 [Bryobacterales bacterium]|jgi:hypothetical protein|nr:hypothetical protein [Bryobacterales bacterium]
MAILIHADFRILVITSFDHEVIYILVDSQRKAMRMLCFGTLSK